MSRRTLSTLALATLCAGAVTAFATPAEADVLGSLADPFRDALSEGSYGLALGLIFLAGLATALTPCVYPMIGITVSVFGARQAKSRAEAMLLSTSFVLGIAALFTPLGIFSALTGSVMGGALTSAWVMIPLSLLFLAMAASMFGAFEMNLPPALQNRLAQIGGAGYRGAFLVGFVSGIIAAPCTGPVITVLLTWVGTSGNVTFGGLSLFVYSLGLGVLFWVVGTFAASLPKSGRWLDSVKSVFGVVMIVLAVHYLRPYLGIELPVERNEVWRWTAIAAAVLGLPMGAVHLSFKSEKMVERVRKGLGVALSVGGLLALIGWLEALPPGARIEWTFDYEAARELARTQNRPLLVDFGADWCGACQELEHEALSDPRVVAEATRFVPVRVDLSADQVTPEKQRLLTQVYQQPGLPLVVMHHSDGSEATRVTGFMEADAFLERMRVVD